jgi:DNA-binding GntR family transcriptional regulator
LRDGVLERRMQRGTHIRRLDRADIIGITAATQHTLMASMVYLARKVASGEAAKTKVRDSLVPKRDQILHSARKQLAHSLLGALRDYHDSVLSLLGNDFMSYMIERVRAEHFHAEYLRAIREGTDLKVVGETYRVLTRAVIAGDANLTSETITRQAAWNLDAIAPLEELPGYLTGIKRGLHLGNNRPTQ